MAFSKEVAERIRLSLSSKEVSFSEKKMFMGVCFMVDDKLCCGTHVDKKTGNNFLLCRIGDDAFNSIIERTNCGLMEMAGRPMKGYVFVTEDGYRSDNDLSHWLQLCLDFNSVAKRSKRK